MSEPDIHVSPETEPVVSRSTVAAAINMALIVGAYFGLHGTVSDVWLTVITAAANLLVLALLAVRTRAAVFSPATVARLLGTRRSG